MVSTRLSFSTINEFNLSYDLVRKRTKVDFEKPTLEFITFKEYGEKSFGLYHKKSDKEKRPFMYYDESTNFCFAVSNNHDRDFSEERPVFFTHENTHAAQCKVRGTLLYPTAIPKEKVIFELFMEGNAEAIAISTLENHERYCSLAVEEDFYKCHDMVIAKSRLGSSSDYDFSYALNLLLGDFQSLKRFAKKYKYTLGYFFSRRNENIPFETLIKNPPKTFEELLVEGVYKL